MSERPQKLPQSLRALALFLAFYTFSSGSEPVFKLYTSSDGLGYDRIRRIVTDSHGLLWFCTSGGLSRFDGSRFINFAINEGLPTTSINDLLETDGSNFWIATNGKGLLKFRVSNELTAATHQTLKSRFQVFSIAPANPASNRINVLFRDQRGSLWLGTDGGLFQAVEAHGTVTIQQISLHLPGHPDASLQIWAIIDDGKGGLWLGTRGGLVRLLADSRRISYPIQPSRSTDDVLALIRDPDGLLWIGHQSGLLLFRPDNAEGLENFVLQQAIEHGPSDLGRASALQAGQACFHLVGGSNLTGGVEVMRASANGHKWIGTVKSGLYEFDGKNLHALMRHTALSDATVSALTEDQDGNLWFGTASLGAGRILHNGIATFADLQFSVRSITQNQTGEMIVSSIPWKLSRFDGQRFITGTLRFLDRDLGASWGAAQCILQDHLGEWWVASRIGLLRYPRQTRPELLADTQPKAVYTKADGLADNDVRHLLEDIRGDIWITNFTGGQSSLTRWERATKRFHQYSEVDGLPSFNTPSVLLEDSKGGVWIGLREGGLARYWDGHLQVLGESAGVPKGEIRSCAIDHTDQLWCGIGFLGLVGLRFNPSGRATATYYSTRNGLSNDVVTAIGEDTFGRIYAGTLKGIDQIDLQDGQIRHLTSVDGLPGGEITQIARDQVGNLWIGTLHGVCRLDPKFLISQHRTHIFISDVRISGVPYFLPISGAQNVTIPELPTQRNSLEIDYMQVHYGPGEEPLCRYKLEGAEDSWSEPTAEDSIHFSNLAPGSYRFWVKSLDVEKGESESATVAFRILPPVWKRPWFVCLVLGVVTAGVLLFAHYRALQIRKIQDSEQRFRTLAETASDAIVTIDESNCVDFANASTEHMFGYDRIQILGQQVTKFIPGLLLTRDGVDGTGHTKHLAPFVTRKAVEAIGFHRDGKAIPIELSSGEFMRNGQLFYTVVIRNITDRKQAEEALRKSQEERLAELERVRRRIATDLHDDIGSSLTQISILSEVLQQKTSDSAMSAPLTHIAGVSRELISSMSDIVWAINPQRDHLSDLVSRMRRFAVDALSVQDIRYHLQLTSEDFKMEGNLRRELLLLFKEGINNIVRHAGCNAVTVALTVEASHLYLVLKDNGRGFDVNTLSEGHGLASMRQRATEIGAQFFLCSRFAEGTSITLKVPLTFSSNPFFPSPSDSIKAIDPLL